MSGDRRWTIFVCPKCGKRHGGRYFCRCAHPASRCLAVEVVPEADHLARIEELEAERDKAEDFARKAAQEVSAAQERAEKEIARANETRENANAASLREERRAIRAEAERDEFRGNWLTSDRAARDAEQALSSLRSKVEQAVSKLREDPQNQEPREVAAMLERAILDETGGQDG